MNTKKLFGAAAVVTGSVLFAGVASAQSKDEGATPDTQSSSYMPAPTHAIELKVATGYAQGFGDVGSNLPSLTDTANPGGAVELGVGYRIVPRLTIGVYGSGAAFGRGSTVDSSANLYSATAGVDATWHVLPYSQLAPWVSLGSGWRGYWITADQGNVSRQGLELAKLQVGLDYRLTPGVAISPVLGADASMFLTQSTPDTSGFHNVSSPNVDTFVFGGVLGRFDIPTGGDSKGEVARR
jgi:hypothetical protein